MMNPEYYNNLFGKTWENAKQELEIEFFDDQRHFAYKIKGKDKIWIEKSFPDERADENTLAIWVPNIILSRHSIIIKYQTPTSIIVSLPEIQNMKFEAQ